jgi:phosphoglycolate phosphatase
MPVTQPQKLPILFDLDGTLVHSAPDIHAAVNRVLAGMDQPLLTLATVTSFIGNGVPRLIERVIAELGLDTSLQGEMVRQFHTQYDDKAADLSHLYPGVIAALKALHTQGHPLGLCTNKPTAPTLAMLQTLGLSAFFPVVICGDTLPVRKPDPAPLHEGFRKLGGPGLFVGDSEIDAETAARAGLPFLLFTKGYRKAAVSGLPNRAVFDDFSQLPDLAAKM